MLPFLVSGYIFQLYNAYVLAKLTFHADCVEWQVMKLFFFLNPPGIDFSVHIPTAYFFEVSICVTGAK